VINAYYLEKVLKIRAGRGVQNSTRESAAKPRRGDTSGKNNFSFGLANAGRISKVIAGLKRTSPLGTDGIPVAVLKMGSDVLAGPISHLVNMSLSAGVFPSAFKTALIHPVYKGGGKARNDPASYRPVAILCALSKVLETVAKEDLEAFLKANGILPTLQHRFRKGRSCTTALATAHAAWVSAKAKGKVVAVVGFDLSAAFNTVGREDLLLKMLAMGIREKALKWFRCYLTNAKQRVVLIRDCLPSALLILSSRIGCFLFCGFICTAFSYSKWLPFPYQCTLNQLLVKQQNSAEEPTCSNPVSVAPIRASRSLRCRASTFQRPQGWRALISCLVHKTFLSAV
jgi:hypothetical protein